MNQANHICTFNIEQLEFTKDNVGIQAKEIKANPNNFRQGLAKEGIIETDIKKGDFFLINFDYRTLGEVNPETYLPFTLNIKNILHHNLLNIYYFLKIQNIFSRR